MDVRDLGQHISQRFDSDLDELQSKVLKAGGLVEQQLADALRALGEEDSGLAEAVIARDHEVNDLELEIDEDCALILARRQPVASDLRLLISVIKAITDIERMGDESVRIARMAVRHSERPQPNRPPSGVRHLGNHVRGMLHDALDAFARFDLEMAARVVAEDRSVDREYESLTRELITFMMEDPRAIPHALDVLFSARALERIGDRACNICEYVFYYVRGKDVRHEGPEAIRREAEKGL
ncbi:MAG: phosphate signaling complex protein PhoU [Gammaproteobacteria bacterium]|nr:phosphate signaling complex protein PhoU [Gammaproteobacteria bacterium]